MDDMDIDQIVEVPDTPDRFTKQGINGRNGVKVNNHRSSYTFNGQPNFSEEGTRNQPMLIDSGSRGRPMHPPKRTNSPSNSRRPNTYAVFPSASPSSSRNAIFRKGVAEKNPKHLSHDSMHNQHLLSMRPPKSSSFSHSGSFPDPTEGTLHRPVSGNASMSGLPGDNQGDFRKRTGFTKNGTSSHGLRNLSIASSVDGLPGDSQGDFRKRTGFTKNGTSSHGLRNLSIASSVAPEEGVDCVGNDNKKPGSGGFRYVDSTASPRVNRQKRLVRNGCISPNNIAKVKQVSGKEIDCSVAVAHNDVSVASSAPPISTDIRELISEDSDYHTKKGKGVISIPCTSKGPNFQNKNLRSRSPMSFSEKAESTDESSSGGWRSTRNRNREIINITSPDHEPNLNRERDTTTQHHENRLERRGKGISFAGGDDYSKEPSFISSELARPFREPLYPRACLGRPNVPRSADLLIKRQKQGSNSSIRGECSTPVSDDPEVVFLSSSTEADNSNSTSSNVGNIQQIIEVDELSPQLRRNARDEDAKTRQLEADELLARELQEQFYNEVPLSREVDEQIALALRGQEGSSPGFPQARLPVPNARSTSNLHRQSQPRPSPIAPRRAMTRAATLGRMTRMRNRFPGQARTLLASRGGRTSMFPPDMDVDMRMHILGALEDLNEMGVSSSILQADRDFNEDDYEMLLALDENNHQHGGASIHRINGLPQSTVQSDNFEEACAICLDTPTVGDTIRHLPCLHKFHKDCIDPWLTRRPSCPICKSSIT